MSNIKRHTLRFTSLDGSTNSTVNAAAGWVDWNLGAAYANRVIAVMFRCQVAKACGIRPNGSALDRKDTFGGNTRVEWLVELDASGICEVYDVSAIGGEANIYQLMGYWE